MSSKTILDVFHQSAQEGIPVHWCVQYKTDDSVFLQYEYFNSHTEANEYAIKYGYKD